MEELDIYKSPFVHLSNKRRTAAQLCREHLLHLGNITEKYNESFSIAFFVFKDYHRNDNSCPSRSLLNYSYIRLCFGIMIQRRFQMKQKLFIIIFSFFFFIDQQKTDQKYIYLLEYLSILETIVRIDNFTYSFYICTF